MNIELPFGFKEDSRTFLRRCGYAEFNDYNSGKTSYTRRFGSDFYPRFHIYVKDVEGKDIINLHLDQKKPSYAGSTAHSGEYDGPLIEQEARRIVGLIKNQMDNQASQPKPVEKKGFFSKLFS